MPLHRIQAKVDDTMHTKFIKQFQNRGDMTALIKRAIRYALKEGSIDPTKWNAGGKRNVKA